jgi:hypothetical protein
MLVVNDRRFLGDSHLDPTENLAKIREGNKQLTDKNRIAGQSELENSERSGGARMSVNELIRKITRLNYNIRVEDGSPGNIAVYVLKTNKELAESYNEDNGDTTRHAWHQRFKYVTGVAKEPLPEYATITVDERGLPKREIRGWRSVLISLVKARALSYQQAIDEFGDANGQRSWRWHEQLRGYKQ